MPELPTEIIVEILKRLTPKPLCRFKCVAKHFKTLISSPTFIKLHLNQTLISQNPNLIICYDSLSSAEIPSTNPTKLRFSAVDHPVKHLPNDQTVQLIGTVNGVACISDHYKKTLFLFNPETKTHRLIPPVPSNIPDCDDPLITKYNPFVYKQVDHIVVFGFGYNVDDDDYKVLRVIECYVDRLQECREVRLYSLRNDSWKRVEDECVYPNQQMDGVFVDGCFYFAVTDENEKLMIKCFNLRDERFCVFDMFVLETGFDNYSFVLRGLGGCFCVMVNYLKHDLHLQFGWRVARADLWTRKGGGKKGDWVRLFSVREPRKIGSSTHIRPVVYSRDGGRVLLELDGSKLGWYDWEREKFERVKTIGLSSKETPFDSYTYVSSLVSLRTDKEKAEGKTVTKKSINKKCSGGFLSTGFKLRL